MDFLGTRTKGADHGLFRYQKMEAEHGLFREQNNGGRPLTFKVSEQWGQTMDFLGVGTMGADHGLFRYQNNGGRTWTI